MKILYLLFLACTFASCAGQEEQNDGGAAHDGGSVSRPDSDDTSVATSSASDGGSAQLHLVVDAACNPAVDFKTEHDQGAVVIDCVSVPEACSASVTCACILDAFGWGVDCTLDEGFVFVEFPVTSTPTSH